MSKVYIAAGQATFAHECEGKRHSVTIGWSAGDPALDENSLPPCTVCGKQYERVEADTEHPIAGTIERSDDHTAGLAEPEPDELGILEKQRQFTQWVIGHKQVIAQTAALLEADKFASDWHRKDAQLTHDIAVAALKRARVDVG